MTNSAYTDWLADEDYFSAMAVFSVGPLHPLKDLANDRLARALEEAEHVLEIGMGTGWTHRFVRDALGVQVTSLEPNEHMRRTAMEDGVDPRRIIAARIEDRPAAGAADDADFLVAQAVLGFVDDGPRVLEQLLAEAPRKGVQIVDWLPGSEGEAADRLAIQPHSLAAYIAAVENADLAELSVEVRRYHSSPGICSEDEAWRRACLRFPEALELGGREQVLKKARQCSFSTHSKRAFVLTARFEPSP